jgi:hypothetical protein
LKIKSSIDPIQPQTPINDKITPNSFTSTYLRILYEADCQFLISKPLEQPL